MKCDFFKSLFNKFDIECAYLENDETLKANDGEIAYQRVG